MALAHPAETLAFDMQEMLQERVVVISEKPAQTRNRLTRRLSETFEQIVTAIEPDLVLEVGAHDATFAKRMAQALPHAEVLAFEAHPGNVARFGPAAREAGVAYHHLAMLEAPGTLELQVPLTGDGGERIGMGSLRTLPDRDVATYAVEASSLDTFFPGDGRASAMWIDVEGAQHEVLSGGWRCWSAARPSTWKWSRPRNGAARSSSTTSRRSCTAWAFARRCATSSAGAGSST